MRPFFVLISLVLTVSAVPASADVVSKLQDCSTFAVNETRLACYDKLAAETPTSTRAAAPTPIPKKPPAPKAATAVEVKAIVKALKERMKDPESVRVQKIVGKATKPGVYEFCGEVNAKNSYGGYIGFKAFIAVMTKENKKIVGVDSIGIDSDSYAIYEVCAEKGIAPQ